MAAGANCKSLRLHTLWTIRHSLNHWRNQLSANLITNCRFVLTISVPYPLATIEYRYNEEEGIRGGVRQLPGIRRGPVNSAVFVAAMRKRSPLSTPVTHPSDNTWNVIDNALFATCAALTVPTTAAPRRAAHRRVRYGLRSSSYACRYSYTRFRSVLSLYWTLRDTAFLPTILL